jgi:hypothetical protein
MIKFAKPYASGNTVQIFTRMSEKEAAELKRIAKEEGTRTSEVVRVLIREGLRQLKSQPRSDRAA